MRTDLGGIWRLFTDKQAGIEVLLPGTLDENKVGEPDVVAKAWHPDVEERNKTLSETMQENRVITSRLTRNYIYEGPAHFVWEFKEEIEEGKRYFLVVERSRVLSLKIDEEEVACISGTLSTPYRFEVTGKLHKGSKIELTSDNSYPGLPYKDIVFSSAATDESQTNWNGLIGDIYVEEKEQSFISNVLVYPMGKELEICVEMSLDKNVQNAALKIKGECFEKEVMFKGIGRGLEEEDNSFSVRLPKIPLSVEAFENKWDEYEGNLHRIEVLMMDGGDAENTVLSRAEAEFGIRSFSYDNEGRLTLNGRRIFLRSEANCGFFPETGHPPMDEGSWEKIVGTYKAYGVNCLRFHSWCPTEADFKDADKLGVLIQPELSNWNPRNAFGTEESRQYYEKEMREILETYGNHPSFVMLSWGNELHTDEKGIDEMHRLLELARRLDKTRLYAWGSNNFYGARGADENSDFYTASAFRDKRLRLSGNTGPINSNPANAKADFDDALTEIRTEYGKPVFGFEVGQYEILPDFDEIEDFKGVTRPDNLSQIKKKVAEPGIPESEWKNRVSATGEIALWAYREEVEAVLRTKAMSGISLLGLQDFPGQGTALVGMLNTHLQKKPYDFAEPSRFHAFFKDALVLALLPKYTYTNNEVIEAEVKVANYGKNDICGELVYRLVDMRGEEFAKGSIVPEQSEEGHERSYKAGELTLAGKISIDTNNVSRNTRFDLILSIEGYDCTNTYPIWVYMDKEPVRPDSIYETECFDAKAKEILERGGKVYLTPPSTKEAMPSSIKAQYTTDFWSVGTFPAQEGAMGQLIDVKHPIFNDYPTEYYTNRQWWHMATQRALVLPEYKHAIITEMDCYAYLRPMAQLIEAKCGNGKIMISSMGLQDLQQYPETKAFLSCLYKYMDSDDFEPMEVLGYEDIEAMIG